MILRMTGACNNSCPFCLVDDEIARRRFHATSDLLDAIDATPPSEEIDIFGGEPTIYPSFWTVVERALSTRRTVTLATNARLFHDRRAARRLAVLGQGSLIVRTSLMGDTPELHDRLNAAPRAFEQTLSGIRNLCREGFAVRVNVVLLADNVDRILPTALIAMEAGVRDIKFSGLIRTHHVRDMVPDPATVRRQLAATIPLLLALGTQVRLEKLPFCLASDYVQRIQPETDPERNEIPWYRKEAPCADCAVSTACSGGELGALERFGHSWMRPMSQPPAGTIDLEIAEIPTFQASETARIVRLQIPPFLRPEEVASTLLSFRRKHPEVQLIV